MSQRPSFSRDPEDLIEPDNDEEGLLLKNPSNDDDWEKNSPSFMPRFPSPKSLRNDPRMPKPFHKTKTGFLTVVASALVVCTLVLLLLRNTIRIGRLRQLGIPPGLYSRDGVLYVGENTPFMIKGFSWYGMEDPGYMPGGLDVVSIDQIFEFTRKFRFNAIRLPLSVENIIENRMGHTSTFKNPELAGLSHQRVLKAIVRKAAENNLLVLLDAHRLKSNQVKSKGLWYTDEVNEDRLVSVWKILCDLLKDDWNVMGADVYNEPWDGLWSSRNKSADWKRAAERLGNSVHESCPSWTIFIEGIGNRDNTTKTHVFWSENLRGLQKAPPQLQLKSKVVLSPHVYGPSVFNQTYFKAENFPENMPAIWDDHFGEANRATGIATVLGEWGGHFVGKDKKWQLKLFEYIKERRIPFFYWCLNPESRDTGGLLNDDWLTPTTDRLEMLESAPSTNVENYAVHFKHWRYWRVKRRQAAS